MALTLITAPAVEPITMAEAREHLRVDHTDDDTMIALYISAARANAEAFLGIALVAQTWELTLDAFPADEIEITLAPLIEVTSVIYLDLNGDEQTLNASEYTVDLASVPGRIAFVTSWPSTDDVINAVRVRFIVGHSVDSPLDLTDIPDIKAGILLTIGTLYANRETVVAGTTAVQLPWGVEALLRPHRVRLGMA